MILLGILVVLAWAVASFAKFVVIPLLIAEMLTVAFALAVVDSWHR